MKIWVDADSCPRVIKEILSRAAVKREVQLILVANLPLQVPPSRFIRTMRVEPGFNVADSHIVELITAGDLVITADIPLAAAVVEKDGYALNPRGEFYTRDNIMERLSMRDFMAELRNGGIETGGPPSFGKKDRQAFANQLDRFLAGGRAG